MKGTVSRTYYFDAAHKIECFGQGHKCGRLHGHTWRVEIFVEGQIIEKTGIVLDYYEIDKAWKPVFKALDHTYLNDVPDLGIPSTENIASYIWWRLHTVLLSDTYHLSKLVIREGATDSFTFEGRAL